MAEQVSPFLEFENNMSLLPSPILTAKRVIEDLWVVHRGKRGVVVHSAENLMSE